MFENLVRRKPLRIFQNEAAKSELHPEFGLVSLVLFGVGATVGSGIFVTSGQIAQQMAGPATALSWLVAGAACLITALAYAEFSTLLRSPGGAYAFSYYGLGELFAITAAYMLTLECGMSGAAVARNWGDKLAYWISINNWGCADYTTEHPFCSGFNQIGDTSLNPAALLMSALMAFLVLMGVKISKWAVNILVSLKITLVVFVIVVGFVYMKPANMEPFVPPPSTNFVGGFSGIMTGASTAFFGYIGFDEVCVMVAETKNPVKTTPRAVMATICCITILYVVASLALTGMVPYQDIDPNEGFGSAFVQVGASWAMQVTVIGELAVALPTVVLVSYLPQSRIFYAVSKDGQMPAIFSRVSRSGNLFFGSLVSGIIFTVVAFAVPFASLNDLISGGILLSFVLTNTSLMLSRTQQKGRGWISGLVLLIAALCGVLAKADLELAGAKFSAVGLAVVSILAFVVVVYKYDFAIAAPLDTFRVPLVPFVPTVAIFVNFYLFWQISWVGIFSVIGLVVLAFLTYFFYGRTHSVDFTEVVDIGETEPQVKSFPSDDQTSPAGCNV